MTRRRRAGSAHSGSRRPGHWPHRLRCVAGAGPRRRAGRTHGSHPRTRSPPPDRRQSVFPVAAGRAEQISPGRISLPSSTHTQAQPLRGKLASSSFVVAVPSGGLFLDVSQLDFAHFGAVSYTHLTLPTIYSV